jgi:hypothetical protein
MHLPETTLTQHRGSVTSGLYADTFQRNAALFSRLHSTP